MDDRRELPKAADVVVIGGGVYGCSIAYNLVRHGAGSVVLLERGELCSGGTAKSCAIVRTHYSIHANMVHAVESLKIFEHFGEAVGGDAGWRRTGYIVLGPEEHREPMETVFQAQNELGIDTATLTTDEARRIHPLLTLDDVEVIGYDTQAGYCDPYLVTTSYAARAKELGARVLTDTPVTGLEQDGGVTRVTTPSGAIETEAVVLAVGPWTNALAAGIGVQLPYEVSRHKVITLKASEPYHADWPVVKDLTTEDKIYFRPETGGAVLVGTGDQGDPVQDPDTQSDYIGSDYLERIGAIVSRRMPSFENAEYTGGWTGLYDIPPDWNPLLGPVPGIDGV
ncbi:MAG: FAD-binding oxidoreductase, partial [Chloroflexi bacterium]|nr:FAD-binding oxidoreductase [Chloroflexota bacterium]